MDAAASIPPRRRRPLSEPTEDEEAAAAAAAAKRPAGEAAGRSAAAATSLLVRVRSRFRSYATVLLLVAAAAGLLSPPTFRWLHRRYHYFLGCPEKALFTRRPAFASRRKEPKLLYLTAKFGPPNNAAIPRQVSDHVTSMLSKGLSRPEEVVSYTTPFPRFLLGDPTWERHLRFYTSPSGRADRSFTAAGPGHPARGGGYWFWKPALILHHLTRREEETSNDDSGKGGGLKGNGAFLADGDFLVYSDVDRIDFLSWLAFLIETMEERGADLAMEQTADLERVWTKGDIYAHFNNATNTDGDDATKPDEDDTANYSAALLVIRKNAATIQFIEDWVGLVADYHLVSDERSVMERDAMDFRDNRHDQSLLSMMLKHSYRERGKARVGWDCLGDWTTYTFRLS